jgi:hypothetical protein
MTAEPNEPVEPPQNDAADLPPDPTADMAERAAGGTDDETDKDDDTDAMGIDDDDPIDATLVGKPVDSDEEPPD